MSNTDTPIKRFVFPQPFGRGFRIYVGHMLATDLTREQAEKLAAGHDEEVQDMLKTASLEALRTRRIALVAERKELAEAIDRLKRTEGRRAEYQLGLKTRALARCEQKLQALIGTEIKQKPAAPTVDDVAREAEEVIAELERILPPAITMRAGQVRP